MVEPTRVMIQKKEIIRCENSVEQFQGNLQFGFCIHSLVNLKGIYSVFQIKYDDAKQIKFCDCMKK